MIATPDERRFEAIVLPHLDSAFNLARWLTRNDQDAEDVVQEAYLRAFRFFDGFRGTDGRPWLLGIVRNTFYTWYEQNRLQRESAPFDEEMHADAAADSAAAQLGDDPETLVLRADDRRRLHEALEKVAVEFREILVLRELEELSYREIAGIARIPVGTVMSRLARGRKRLTQILAGA